MCTSILVGKKATDPEMVLIARNEDFQRNNWDKYMMFRPYPEYAVPAEDNPFVNADENQWTLGNGLTVTVPEKAFSYSAMPDSSGYEKAPFDIENRFYFEERGINEKNVAISATNSMEDINNEIRKIDPFTTVGIEESIIPTLILPQAESARDAVALLAGYINAHGSHEGNGILISDPNESWYFEIGSCHHWVALRVPDHSYLVVANGLRIHDVDLDSKDVLHSDGLYEFVCKHELLRHPDKHAFNFAMAFGQPGNPYNVDRIWLAQRILSPSILQKPRQFQYPLFLEPEKNIQIQDIMAVLRATYEGTELAHDLKATRPIGVDRTAESHIIVFEKKMPDQLKGTIWQALGTPLGAPYMPFYSVMTDIPRAYSVGKNQYSPESAYWAFRGLYALASLDHHQHTSEIRRFWSKYEQKYLGDHEHLNEMLRKSYEKAPGSAIQCAKTYSTGIAYQTVVVANKRRNELITQVTQAQKERCNSSFQSLKTDGHWHLG